MNATAKDEMMDQPMTAPENDRSRWTALYVLCVGMLMIVLDVTVVNVALPSIQDDLGFSQSSLAWVVNAYLIAFGGLLLLAGRVGDLIGRRVVFLAVLAVFTTASLVCGLATAVLALRLVDKDEGIGLDRGADALGAALVTVALMLGVYTILEAGDYGWGSLRTLGLGGIAVALLGAFIARQSRTPNPLVPLRIFRSRNVSGANAVQMLMVAGLFGLFFLGVLYLQGVLGYDAIETGLAFLPVSVLIGVLSLWLSPRLNERFGARATLLAGLVLLVAAPGVFPPAPPDAGYVVDLLPSMVLFGIGAGLAFPALMTLAMSGATAEDSGLASGLVNTSLQVGGAVGLAVLATLSATRTDSLLADGEPAAEALTGGYRFAFVVAAGLVVVAVGLASTVLRSEARAAAETEAEVGDPVYSEA